MNEDLQNKLYEKYSKIFRQKDLSAQETCMCWGITCGDGWFDLLDMLCGQIQNRVDNVNRNRSWSIESGPKTLIPTKTEVFICEATQVKTKWGGLRFYTDGGDDYIDGLISMAESMSYRVCENCGAPGRLNKKGWLSSLCEKCREDHVSRDNK